MIGQLARISADLYDELLFTYITTLEINKMKKISMCVCGDLKKH